MTFPRISIAVVVTVLVVYFGLNLIFPHHKFEPKMAGGPTPAEVFSSSTSAASSSAPAPADGATTTATPSSAEAASASGGEKSLTEAEARKIAEDVGRKVAIQVATQLLQQQGKTANAAAAVVSDEDVHRIAQAEVHKAVEDQPAAVPAETVAPETSKVSKKAAADENKAEQKAEKAQRIAAAKAARAEARSTSKTEPKKESKQSEPPAEPNTAWWAAADGARSGLGLSFAGEAASQRAIALLFNSPLGDAADAGSHITVTNAAGKRETGPWSLAQNPRMLLLHVANPGRYAVKVGADLADGQGKKLGIAVQGPVFVH